MSYSVDLHVHTSISDGTDSPATVVGMAESMGLRAIAITDHDAVGGIAEATRAARGLALEVLPGVEISADAGGLEIHILGYLIEYASGPLLDLLAECSEWRLGRTEAVLAKLRALGASVSWQRVQMLADKGTIGRPHIARAMVEAGHVRSVQQAFAQYLGQGCPAFVERPKPTPAEAIHAIGQAGGVAVLAHPWGLASLLPALVAEGLAGLEVYYAGYGPQRIALLQEYARSYHLVCTGGSDYHGLRILPDNPLGGSCTPASCVEELKARCPLTA